MDTLENRMEALEKAITKLTEELNDVKAENRSLREDIKALKEDRNAHVPAKRARSNSISNEAAEPISPETASANPAVNATLHDPHPQAAQAAGTPVIGSGGKAPTTTAATSGGEQSEPAPKRPRRGRNVSGIHRAGETSDEQGNLWKAYFMDFK